MRQQIFNEIFIFLIITLIYIFITLNLIYFTLYDNEEYTDT